MPEERAPAWRRFLLLLGGGLAVAVGGALVQRPTGPSGVVATPSPAPSPSPRLVQIEPLPPAKTRAGWLADARPALQLIEDFMGVRTAPLSQSKLWRTGRDDPVAVRGEVERLLNGEQLSCEAVAARGLLDETRQKTRASGDPGLDDLLALNDMLRPLCLLRDAAPSAEVRGVRFVIATLPDYVDSSSDWNFDLDLDGVQSAAAKMGYVLDRFYLPDLLPAETQRAEGSAPVARGRLHEQRPGAVLFRKTLKDGRELELLLVLLVPESPTQGLHKDALMSALSLVVAWKPRDTVLILGPSFSGAAVSMRAALRVAFDERLVPRQAPGPNEPRVRIISGSATNPQNKRVLDGAGDPRWPVVFGAMTASDSAHIRVLKEYLGEINENWREGNEMALLVESNTGRNWNADRDSFPNAHVFPFPVHISRLREEAGVVRRKEEVSARPVPHLSMLENVNIRDHLPSLTPTRTPAMVDTALANILDSIDRLSVTAVGILATDKRDHLFLAREITRRSPNVLLFATEENLIYLHPDYRAYVRGAVVVGSYPLFVLTQERGDLSRGQRKLHQFPSMRAQGIHNALLALLDEPEKLKDHLVDYGSRGPKVWVGVVGHDAVWPVRATDPSEDEVAYSWHPPAAAVLEGPLREARAWGAEATPFRWPVPAKIVAAVIAGAMLLHAWVGASVLVMLARPCAKPLLPRWLVAFLPPVWASAPVPGGEADRARSLRQEYWLSLAACIGAVACAASWFIGVTGPRPAGRWAVGIAAALVGAAAVAAVWPRGTTLSAVDILRSLVVSLGLVALWGLGQIPGSHPEELTRFHTARALAFNSLVSPGTTVLFLLSALYSWGLWNLRRLHAQAEPFAERSPLLRLLGSGGTESGEEAVRRINEPALSVGPWGVALVALFVAFAGRSTWLYCHTVDGPGMALVIWAGSLFVMGLCGHVLAYCVRLGQDLLKSLRALNRHPLGQGLAGVAGEPFHWGLSLRPSQAGSLTPLVLKLDALALTVRDLNSERSVARGPGERPPAPGSERRGDDRAPAACEASLREDQCERIGMAMKIRAADVALIFPDARADTARPHGLLTTLAEDARSGKAFQATRAWQVLERVSGPLLWTLERGPWARRPYSTEAEAPFEPHHRQAETILAAQIAFVIKHLLARLVSGLTFAVGGLALILLAHLLYSFQGRPFWLALDWVAIGIGTTIALSLTIQLEKDPVLSRLWGTHPGRIDWHGGFIYRIVGYIALVVVALFVSFFPEVGNTLFAWTETFRRALP